MNINQLCKSLYTFDLSDFALLQVQSLEDAGFDFQFAPRISVSLKNKIAQFWLVFKNHLTPARVYGGARTFGKGASVCFQLKQNVAICKSFNGTRNCRHYFCVR